MKICRVVFLKLDCFNALFVFWNHLMQFFHESFNSHIIVLGRFYLWWRQILFLTLFLLLGSLNDNFSLDIPLILGCSGKVTDDSLVSHLLNLQIKSDQVGTCKHILEVDIIICVESLNVRASLRPTPERLTLFSFRISWEKIQ